MAASFPCTCASNSSTKQLEVAFGSTAPRQETRIARVSRRLIIGLPVVLLLGAYTLLRSAYWRCPPIWDGRWDYLEVLNAAESKFDLLRFSVEGHVSQALFLFAALPYPLFHRNYFYFNVWLTLLGLLAIVAFYRLLTFFTDNRLSAIEYSLITSVFAFHPSVLASSIHFTCDLGLLVFGLWFWLLLLEERKRSATFLAILSLFSKETSFALLPLLFLFCCFLKPSSVRLSWFRDKLDVMVNAYVGLACFLAYKTIAIGEPAVWHGFQDFNPFRLLFHYLRFDPSLIAFFGMALILNFSWLMALAWVVLLIASYVTSCEHRESKSVSEK